MSEFKVGDIVRVVGPDALGHLREGAIHTVTWSDGLLLKVAGLDLTWKPHRFELVKPAKSWDDRVESVGEESKYDPDAPVVRDDDDVVKAIDAKLDFLASMVSKLQDEIAEMRRFRAEYLRLVEGR